MSLQNIFYREQMLDECQKSLPKVILLDYFTTIISNVSCIEIGMSLAPLEKMKVFKLIFFLKKSNETLNLSIFILLDTVNLIVICHYCNRYC